ncbi:MAG: hypothetical protein ACRDZU_09555 [Acidimicrobiales bacterium]
MTVAYTTSRGVTQIAAESMTRYAESVASRRVSSTFQLARQKAPISCGSTTLGVRVRTM